MTSLESLDREIKKALSNVPPRTQFMERRLEYWNNLHMVWGADKKPDKFTMRDVPKLEIGADEYLNNREDANEMCYMDDLCAFAQREVDEQYYLWYCENVKNLREVMGNG